MSVEELFSIRPNAKKITVFPKSELNKESFELMEILRNDSLTTYWYRFRENSLRAIIKGGHFTNEAELSLVSKKIKSDIEQYFSLNREDKILRSSGVSNYILTAHLWNDSISGLNLYSVFSLNENTLILFDPKFFSRTDFFIDPVRKPSFDRNNEVIANMISNFTIQKQQQASQTPKQRSSSVLSNFVPNPFSKTNQIPKKRSASNSSILSKRYNITVTILIVLCLGIACFYFFKKKF